MARCVQVWACLVDRSVDDEASAIHHCVGASDPIPFTIDVYHVRDCEYTKVHSIRIDPEGFGLDGIWGNISNCLIMLHHVFFGLTP